MSFMSLDSILSKRVAVMNKDMDPDPGRTPHESKAIFVLGNTGCGKSTVTQIIAGRINQLKAEETEGGDLIIVDEGDKIGSSTRSKTLYPEYMIHPKTGVAFWDTPGFDDNRSIDETITAMYLLKHALDTTTFAKFIFAVNHSSVKTGNDRLDFDLLASHATTLLKDITKMRNSLGLLVTKVGSYSPSGKYLSDEEILAKIQFFLKTYVKTKTEDLESLQKEEVGQAAKLQAKIDFVQSLIGKNGMETQAQIFFVRSPECEGPLEKISSIFESQNNISELYSKILNYTRVSSEDFQFTLKADTLLKIENELMPNVKNEIAKTFYDFEVDMRVKFQERFHDLLYNSPENSLQFLLYTSAVMKNYLQKSKNNSELGSFCSELEELHKRLQFSMNNSYQSDLKGLEKRLDFYTKILNQNRITTCSPLWIEPFSNFLETLDQLKQYYDFCNIIEVELASYEKVGTFRKLVVENADANSGFQFQDSDVLNFLQSNALISIPAKVYAIWEHLKDEDKEYMVRLVKRLTPVLEKKYSKSSLDPEKYRLVITGRNIKLSDAMNEDKWPLECKYGKVKELSLVALDKLFLDINVEKTGAELQLSMVAPRWEVHLLNDSIRHINLSGVQPKDEGKAASATQNGGDGQDGKAGKRGGDAGSFLGVYAQVQNSEMLLVSANGGNGGNGQEGGNGMDGAGGRDATWDTFPNAYNFPTVEKTWTDILPLVIYNSERYIQRGRPGLCGRSGGNGGNGGEPGNRGTILLVPSSGNSKGIKIQTSSDVGKLGSPGAGGKGGKGGKHGNDYSCKLNNFLFVGFKWDSGRTEHRTDLASSGNDGNPGNAGVLNTALTPVNMVSREINEYLMMYSRNKFRTTFSKELLNNLEISNKISSQPQSEKLLII